MINSILVENFQSHKKTQIDFDPGVNVIVGRSDSGKSAVIRALYWALFNRPTGEDFISDWGGSAEVHLDFDDGQLARIRNKSFNGYIIGEEEYKGFGQNVPEPISKFINMTRINFQHQMDSPFMLSWSPGDIGTFINNTVDLKVIDRAIHNIKVIIKSESKQINAIQFNIEDAQEQLEDFKDIEEIDSILVSLEKKQERIDCLSNKCGDLEELIEDIEDVEKRLEKASEVLKAQRSVEHLCSIQEEVDKLESVARTLQSLLSAIINLENSIDRYSKEIKNMKEEFHNLMPDECPLCGE